ncbi:hypothetical protein GGR57DRAFT_466132 [Xylariaceae sp. FL1272]|nr:hypothetical protein GGR57DRAFT_466132 [Xylariaceae sp. FL1272]
METCISLQHGLPTQSDTSNFCSYQTDGGVSTGHDCSEGTFDSPVSFVIRNGFCTVFEEDGCSGFSNGVTDSEYTNCTNLADIGRFYPDTWLSMKCYADEA